MHVFVPCIYMYRIGKYTHNKFQKTTTVYLQCFVYTDLKSSNTTNFLKFTYNNPYVMRMKIPGADPGIYHGGGGGGGQVGSGVPQNLPPLENVPPGNFLGFPGNLPVCLSVYYMGLL